MSAPRLARRAWLPPLPSQRSHELIHGVSLRFSHGRPGGSTYIYPLVMTNSLLLKMSIEIVDFPIKHGDYSTIPSGYD